MTTAILVDGGFYRKRAAHLWGKKTAKARADELTAYCLAHLKDKNEERNLYRIFYYDCPPLEKKLYHPLTKKQVDMGRSETFGWTQAFFDELKKKRKLALRLGVLAEIGTGYNLKPEITKKLCAGKIGVEDLKENDFDLLVNQKGVDMRIGIDIASLTYKKQVNQIILIAGDSDFVPAAKMARREGIDFILDPMWADIKADLFEHIDGLKSNWKKQSNRQGAPSIKNKTDDQ